jgi:hypothetical protein
MVRACMGCGLSVVVLGLVLVVGGSVAGASTLAFGTADPVGSYASCSISVALGTSVGGAPIPYTVTGTCNTAWPGGGSPVFGGTPAILLVWEDSTLLNMGADFVAPQDLASGVVTWEAPWNETVAGGLPECGIYGACDDLANPADWRCLVVSTYFAGSVQYDTGSAWDYYTGGSGIGGSEPACSIDSFDTGALPPYGWGSEPWTAPYTVALTCALVQYNGQTGGFDLSGDWTNASGVSGVGTMPNAYSLGVAVADSSSDAMTVESERFLPDSSAVAGEVKGDLTGHVTNPGDTSTTGYTFTVEAIVEAPDLSTAVIGTCSVSNTTTGVYPPGAIVCPDGVGTCGNISNCTMDTVTLTVPDGWLFGSDTSFSFPDPLAAPAWIWCAAQQVGEWAVLPTDTVLNDWSSFGVAAKGHVPVVYLYDGSTWVFSFTNELHTAIPPDYVSTACMPIITPGSMPTNGSGGSATVSGGELCGAGATLKGSDQVVAGGADITTLFGVVLVLGFAVGLIGTAVHLLKNKGGA